MKIYSFEKLDAWKQAKSLSVWISGITKAFPDEEKFAMVSQMRRAAISIASNLAEGTSRSTSKDQAWLSNVAFSSAVELLSHLIISRELEFINNENYTNGREQIEKQTMLISQLRKAQITNGK